MNQLAWISDPSLPLDQAREEWGQTRPSDENLVTWAERMQDAPDLMPSTVELEDKAKEWAVPVEVLRGDWSRRRFRASTWSRTGRCWPKRRRSASSAKSANPARTGRG